MGKQVGNLYVFVNSSVPATVCNASLIKTALWHSRLGHPSFTRLSVIGTTLHFTPVTEDVTHCSICHLSKQRRLPFISNNNICNNAFDHIDIWGPFLTVTVENFKYLLTIVDDHTRFTWVYMLRSKSDVSAVFPAFYSLTCTQFGVNMKIVCSDNAPEFNL